MPIFSFENEISFTCKLNSFSYEWLCTGLALIERPKATRKWAIVSSFGTGVRMPPLCGAFNRLLGPGGGEIDYILTLGKC